MNQLLINTTEQETTLLANEVWKDVKGYEGYYQVSNKGRVRSVDRTIKYKNGRTDFKKGRLMNLPVSKGYVVVTLTKNNIEKTFKVHRLELIAFTKTIGEQINHKNGIKADNRIENLEWCTPKENMVHAFKNDLQRKGHRHPNSKIVLDTYTGVFYDSAKEVSLITGVKHSSLKCRLNGNRKKDYRYIYA